MRSISPLILSSSLALALGACHFEDRNDAMGRWADDASTPGETQGDVGAPDSGPDQSGCVAPKDEAICALTSTQCGTIEVTDVCGTARSVVCGGCDKREACDESTNLCTCVPQEEEALCEALGAQCGMARTLDACGGLRDANCGSCEEPGVLCEQNMCSGCLGESNAELCAAQGAVCGTITATDRCGELREQIGCGASCEAPEVCLDGQCDCPEVSRQEFCVAQGADCGTVSGVDRCGVTRTETCDPCTQGTCTGNSCTICTPESRQSFCQRQNNATCGSVSGVDNCGAMRLDVDCGECKNGTTCQGNRCVCPAVSCGLNSCGEISSACGSTTDCGGCDPDASCIDNACQCPSVACLQGSCGTVSNGCGSSSDCGTCPGVYDQCLNNQCQCIGETNSALCLDARAICGNITVTDRCNAQRVVNCGSCSGNQWCQSNELCCAQGKLCAIEVGPIID